MDYPCAELGYFSFSCFGFNVRTDRITESDDRYTHATTVGVSNMFMKRHGHDLWGAGGGYLNGKRQDQKFFFSWDFCKLSERDFQNNTVFG